MAFLLNQDDNNLVAKTTEKKILIAPTCLPFEIGNALSKMIKRNLLSTTEAILVLHEFYKIPIRLLEPDIANSVVIAAESNSYAYDAYYLNIANQLSEPLFTLDEKMKSYANISHEFELQNGYAYKSESRRGHYSYPFQP